MSQAEFLSPAQIAGQYFTGTWIDGDAFVDAIEPGTGGVLGRIAMVSAETLGKSCVAARKAQAAWTDDLAVVDASLKVRGVEGLHVIDASIMPRITSGNTNAPTQALALHASKMLVSAYFA